MREAPVASKNCEGKWRAEIELFSPTRACLVIVYDDFLQLLKEKTK